jgi:hypothetical protein
METMPEPNVLLLDLLRLNLQRCWCVLLSRRPLRRSPRTLLFSCRQLRNNLLCNRLAPSSNFDFSKT